MKYAVTFVVVTTLLLTACGGPQSPKLERIPDRTELPSHQLQSLPGYRDGDVLRVLVQPEIERGRSPLASEIPG